MMNLASRLVFVSKKPIITVRAPIIKNVPVITISNRSVVEGGIRRVIKKNIIPSKVANTPITITEEQQVEIDKILEKLEDDEDVQKVFTNLA